MLAEDPYMHTHLGASKTGPSPAPKSNPGNKDIEARSECLTTLLPEIAKLSGWLQTSDDSDDSGEPEESEESKHSADPGDTDESDGNDRDGGDESDDLEEPDGLTTGDSVDKPWAPPIVTEPDMRFRVDAFALSPLMSVEEHIQKDQYMVEIYTACKKTWPTPEEVVNDVEIATTILSLVILTTSRKERLREQWIDVRNLRLFAEQKIVREKVASAVRWKRFMVLRTLRLWYEGYTF